MLNSRIKNVVLGVGFILAALFLIYWRIPSKELFSETRTASFLFSAFMFLLSAPCFYVVFRSLFGQFLGLLSSVFYVLLAVFPYKIFYGLGVELRNICFWPVPETIFGLGGIWLVIFYFVLSFGAVSAYWYYKTKKFIPAVNKKRVLIFSLLFVAALIQLCPRLGENSPKSVRRELHRENAVNRYRTLKFFDVETGGYDTPTHVLPSGMFKANPEPGRRKEINRRGLNPYLYSLVSTYFHPYYAAIIINGLFYYLIIAAGYLLAKQLGLSEAIAAAYSVLLSANYFLLNMTIESVFYAPYYALVILVVFLAFRLKVFENPREIKNQVLFCFVLACSGLTYDPYVICGTLLLWGLFCWAATVRRNAKGSLVTIVQALIFAIVPACSQRLWEKMLVHYNLQGIAYNLEARAGLFERLFSLPGKFYSDFLHWGNLTIRHIIRLVLGNPVLRTEKLFDKRVFTLGEPRIEYWTLLGLFGVVSLFVFLPRYLNKDQKKGIYACYIANLGIALLSSLAAAIGPVMRYGWIFLAPSRTNHAYLVLILAQSVGIYHITKFFCGKFKIERATEIIAVAIAVCIYMLSFVKLLFL